MQKLKEEPRVVRVIVGEWGMTGFQVWAMVGYDVKSGDPWGTFPPKKGCDPYLIGEPPKIGPDFLYTCKVEWETADGEKHSGEIQVTPVLLPYDWKIEPVRDSE